MWKTGVMKSWCVKAKGGNCCWKRTLRWYCLCYHDGQSHKSSEVVWNIIVTQPSPPLHQEMQLYYIILFYAKRKAFIHFVQKRRVHWAGSHLRWTERQWKHVLWSDESTFRLVSGKNGRRIFCAKDERRSRLFSTKSAKTSLCDGMGVYQCPWVICIYVKVPLMRGLVRILEKYIVTLWVWFGFSLLLFI